MRRGRHHTPSLLVSPQLAIHSSSIADIELTTVVRTLAPFSAALDGNAESSNAYIKYFVPWCQQNTLLTHIATYTAACFLSETGQLDRQVTMEHKSQAINMLNETLWTDFSSNDGTVAAHTQLILNEWYWGGGTDLGAHVRGLREMVRLRGGFRNLGLHGLIAKMAITWVSSSSFQRRRLTVHASTEPTSPLPCPTRPHPSCSPAVRSSPWKIPKFPCA